jgi:tRNA-specific 2-thiouridylase
MAKKVQAKIYVGMSGGVDSSVTAALLKEQGYDVTGVYMKNWSQDLPGFTCPWKEDYQDAKRVAVQLGIDFKMYDFETEYRQKVVDYMVAGYQAGITPNPDIMCNQEVKFKLFLETALEDGADMIATGHYARVIDGQLWAGVDANKDQSYFLYRVTEDALRHTLMPIGELEKPAVRELARKYGLATAEKKDSQGICFVGKVGIKEFLLAELGEQPHGNIINQDGALIGEHDGALFYTIGQRHGLDVGGGLPYYVVGKDMSKIEVYVTTDLQDERLWRRELKLGNLHWINDPQAIPKGIQTTDPLDANELQVRTRYRSPLVDCKLTVDGDSAVVTLTDDIRAITPGQSAVLYDGDRCLGGGIVL